MLPFEKSILRKKENLQQKEVYTQCNKKFVYYLV
ncbi:hypothetical protein X975_08767, partial [Stegodyphus mimosarum]